MTFLVNNNKSSLSNTFCEKNCNFYVSSTNNKVIYIFSEINIYIYVFIYLL